MTEPVWGDPPIPDVVAQLLRARWNIPENDTLVVEIEEEGAATAILTSGDSVFRLRVLYREGAGFDRDPWNLVIDALDALVGQLEEVGRAHRELPAGEDIEFQGAHFLVQVERTIPDLQRLADQLLEGN